ncbi:hypothetical protein ACH9DO_05135 [Kocuria sp. M1N1S27]|uniref:hypothetical protein n=1 Tax=Kocuria kalidii TaxID=3376283 RepID=UPI003798B23E
MTNPSVSQGPADDQEPVHISQVVREMLATYDGAVTKLRNGELEACILVEIGRNLGVPLDEHRTAPCADREAKRFFRELNDDGFTVPELPPLDLGPVPPGETGDVA